ncbi:MAG: TA system VapC family ribonuclease toxin [Verrucomicrobiota bacterium]
MRALFDVNVLIALFDSAHAFHQKAHDWWSAHEKDGWASCPLTENGFVRIMSNPNYSKSREFTPSQLVGGLAQFADGTDHAFWSDGISLRDSNRFRVNRIHSSRKLTDAYLLALAVENGGCLVTFDQGIVLESVVGAAEGNLCVL